MKRILPLLLCLMLIAQPFACALADFALPSGLKNIQEEAFAGNKLISGNLTLPENTQTVGNSAFADTGVFALLLPSATTTVGSGVLSGANAAYVVVGNSAADLADSAFAGVPVIVGEAGSTAQSYAEKHGVQFYDAASLVYEGGFAYAVDRSARTAQLAFPQVRSHGKVTVPQAVSGCSVVSVSAYALTAAEITSLSLPRPAYETLPEQGVNWPDAEISAYDVTIAAAPLSETEVYTYVGSAHAIYIDEELPEDARVTWSAEGSVTLGEVEDAFAIVDEAGEAVSESKRSNAVMAAIAGEGDAVITCEIIYADGTQAEGAVAVHAKPWLTFAAAQAREDLEPGWYYHIGFENVMPELTADLWPQDEGTLVLDGTVVSETLAQTDLSGEGEHVVTFIRYDDEEGTRQCAIRAMWPGEATLIYSADLRGEIANAVRPEAAVSEAVAVSVKHPDIVPIIDPEEIEINLLDQNMWIGFGWEGAYDVQSEKLSSSDESVFTITPAGRILPVSAGEATLTYTVHCYGTVAQAQASVSVVGGKFTLSPSEATMHVGDNLTVHQILPEGLEGEGLGFYSTNPLVAEVSCYGNVAALNAGEAKICCTLDHEEYGEIYAECLITVVEDDPRMSLNAYSIALYENETFQLEATFAEGEEVTDVVFASNEESMVTVSDSGLVTVVADAWSGSEEAIVTCTATFADGSEEVRNCIVRAEAAKVYLSDIYGYYSMSVGEEEDFNYYLRYADGVSREDVQITFTSDDEQVATVSEDGMITALAKGKTRVTVTVTMDGRVVSSKSSYVLVEEAVRQIDPQTDWIDFRLDHYFFLTPAEGEVYHESFGVQLSDDELWSYYEPVFSEASDPNGIFEIDENGHFAISGEGTAEVFVTLRQFDDLAEVPEGFGATATVTVGQPGLEIIVADFDGANAAPLSESNPIDLGDRVTFTLTGVPSEIEHNYIFWGFDGYYLHELERGVHTMTAAAAHVGDTEIHLEGEASNGVWYDIGIPLTIQGEESEYVMGEPVAALSVGDEVELWPDFGWSEGYFTTSDESVVVPVEGSFPLVRAVGVGSAVLTAHCVADDQDVTATSLINVVEPEWGIDGFEPVKVMIVGHSYASEAYVWHNGWTSPELAFTISGDGEVVPFHDEDENEWRFEATKPGRVTVTMTATKDGRSESAQAEITVIEPGFTFADGVYTDLYAGETIVAHLENRTGKEIVSIEASSSRQGIVTLETDDAYPLNLIITAGETDNAVDTIVNVTATFDDGTQETASVHLHVKPPREDYLDLWMEHEYLEIGVGESQYIGINFHSDSEASGVWLESTDTSVATISATGLLTAVAPGDTTIRFTVSNQSETVTREMHVHVRGNMVELIPGELTLSMGEAASLIPSFTFAGKGMSANPDAFGFWSDNENVAMVNHVGLVMAVNPGSTRIWYETEVLETGEWIRASAVVNVQPAQGGLSLSETAISLRPREEFALEAIVDGELTGDITWTVSNEDLLSAEGGVVKALNRMIDTDAIVESVIATAVVDGVETSAVCRVTLLPSAVNIVSSPNYYQLSVGQKVIVPYTLSFNDSSIVVVPTFESTDESIAVINENGVITGVSAGRCMIRLNLRDEDGKLLCSGGAYVFVDTALPTPEDEGTDFGFCSPAYLLDVSDESKRGRAAYDVFYDHTELGVYYPLCFSSDDESIVEIGEDGGIYAHGEGETTIRAWYEGFEDTAVEAKVYVAQPFLSYDKALDENDRPVVSVGDTLKITVENLPPQDVLPIEHIACRESDGTLEVLGAEGNVITLLAVRAREDQYARVEIGLGDGWWSDLETNICVTGGEEPQWYMHEDIAYAAIGEEFEIYPSFNWESGYFTSSDEGVVVPVEGAFPALRGVGEGYATVTAHCMHGDELREASLLVIIKEGMWELVNWGDWTNVHTLVAGETYGEAYGHNMHAYVECTYRRWPEIIYTSSDESILRVEHTDDGWLMTALSKGKVDLTITVSRDGEEQSLTKTLYVVEPEIAFEGYDYSVRPGGRQIIPLRVYTDKEIESIVYTVADESCMSVSDASEEVGAPAMAVTCIGEDSHTTATATVTFTDGTIAYALVRLHPLPNHEVYLNIHANNIEINTEPWGHTGRTQAAAEVFFDTNACLSVDGGADTMEVEWFIDGVAMGEEGFGSGVVEFIGYDESVPYNLAPIFSAVSEGYVNLSAHVTLLDGNGGYICDWNADFGLWVFKPYMNVWFDQDVCELRLGENRYLGTSRDSNHTAPIDRTTLSSDNEYVARFDVHGNIYAAAPGETDVHETVTIAGHTFTATAHVIVRGVELRQYEEHISIDAGKTGELVVFINTMGETINERWWWSENESVVLVNDEGVVYGVAAGDAVVWYNCRTDEGEYRIPFRVTVHGDAPAFTLDQTYLELLAGQEVQLGVVYTGDGEIDEGSIRFESSNEQLVSVDENGVVTSRNNGGFAAEYAHVTCSATVNGESVSASCMVAALPKSVRIQKFMFGNEAWRYMEVGDRMGMHEEYVCTAGVSADVEITVDDESIVVYDADAREFIALAEGQTTAHYTVWAVRDGERTGEHDTSDLILRVGNAVEPESLTPEKEFVILHVNDGERHFGWTFYPQFSDREVRVYSENTDILVTAEYDGRVYPQSPGRTTVHLECLEYPEVNASYEVLVLPQLRVSEATGRTSFAPGETVELTLVDENGEPWWDDTIESVTYDPSGYPWELIQIEENRWTNFWFGGAQDLWVNAEIAFTDGSSFWVDNAASFSVDDTIPYFYAYPDERKHIREIVACVDERIMLNIVTNIEGDMQLRAWSNDESVAVVDEYGGMIGVAYGETEVCVEAQFGDQTYTDTLPVRIIPAPQPAFVIDPEGGMVRVGDVLQLYIHDKSGLTATHYHEFSSGDESILEPVLDEEGVHVYGQFRALKAGTCEITARQVIGFGEDTTEGYASAVFYVIEDVPVVYFENNYLELRPDQIATFRLNIDLKNSGRSIESVEYTSDTEGAFAVDSVVLDDGTHAAGLTGLDASSCDGAQLIATVTFDDGSEIVTSAYVNMISNEEVWVEPYASSLHLNSGDWTGNNRHVQWLSWSHNASFFDEIGQGSDKAWIEWEIEDESIAVLDGYYIFADGSQAPWNNGVMIKGISEGETVIHTKLTITDKDDNFICERTLDIPVYVSGPDGNLWFNRDWYELNVGQREYLEWDYYIDNATEIDGVVYGVDDPNVAIVDTYGHVVALRPGETDVHVSVTLNGVVYGARAHVVVNGVDLSFYQDEITIGQGGTGSLILFMDDHGIGTENPRWTSSDRSVAVVDETGVVYGVAPGQSFITFGVDTDYEYQEIQALVNVVGDTPAFDLNTDGVSLYAEQSFQLEIAAQGEVNEESIVWVSENEDLVQVDENGLVTVVGYDANKDAFATVACHAEMDGEKVFSCAVIRVKRPKLRVCGHQFHDGAWYSLSSGDYLDIWERYELTDGALEVRISYSSSDENVAVWNEEQGKFGMVGAGSADVFYTASVYENGEATGESYTRSAKVIVDGIAVPDALQAKWETPVYDIHDGGRNFEFKETPQYTSCYMRFYSGDESIVSFDNPEDSYMLFNGTGRTTVYVECPGNEHLNFSADVIVVDSEAIELRPVDDREEPYRVQPHETVQLGFFVDGEPFDWYGANVTYRLGNHYDPRRVIVTEDLTLRTEWEFFEEEIHHWVYVCMENGEEIHICYSFTIDCETPYFYAAIEDASHVVSYTGTIGDCMLLDWRTNLDLSGYTVTAESSDESVVTVSGNVFTIVGYGEAALFITADNGEARYSSEFPIRSIKPVEPTRFMITSDTGSFVLHVGEVVQLYADYEGELTYPPMHEFTSSDESVLEPVLDENGWPYYGLFRAVSVGQTVVTMNGRYGDEAYGNLLEASASDVFHVIEAEPKVWFGEHYYELRPDETVTLPLYISDNGSGREVSAIEYFTDDEGLVTLEEGALEDGTPAVTVVGVDASQDTSLNARVTFIDGSEMLAHCWLNMISNEEVYVHSWLDGMELTHFEGEPDQDYYNIQTCWLSWNHNASHFDEIGKGSDLAWIEWFIDDIPMGESGFGSGVLEFAGWHTFSDGTNAPWNNGPRFRAVGSGEVTLKARLVLSDKDGNYLAEHTSEQNVCVCEGYLNIYLSEEEIEMRVGEEHHFEWHADWNRISPVTDGSIFSSDESVVYVDRHCRLYALEPGEASITCRYTTSTGVSREASAHVSVVGPTIAWEDEAMANIALAPGERVTLTASLDMPEDVGYTTDCYWENTNPSVATINWETGEVTALNPGETAISYWQNLEYYTGNGDETAWGECFVYSTITVESEETAFTLNKTAIALAGESTFQLEPVYDASVLGEPLSIRWESDGDVGWVDENGVVYVEQPHRTFHISVTCIAEFEDGERSATCNVTVNRPTVEPNDWQFGEGAWTHLNCGDVERYHDYIAVYDSTVTAQLTFESTNEDVATVDEYGNIYAGDVSGEADIIMTVRAMRDGAYIGESYVRSLHVWVEMDTTAESFEPTYDLFVVPAAWERHYLPITFYPEYTGRYLEYYSHNEDIVSFDEGCDVSEMYFKGALGYVDIDVVCPDDESLNRTARVLVIDEEAYYLEAEDGRRTLTTGDTVQLVLRCNNGDLWSDEDVQSIEWRNYYPDGQYTLTQDGLLTVHVDWDEPEATMWLNVRFRDDFEMSFPYDFSVECP